MTYPTLTEIASANREQLEQWFRRLPSPDSPSQRGKISEIAVRLARLDGGKVKDPGLWKHLSGS